LRKKPLRTDVDKIDVVADRGYFKIEDIEACDPRCGLGTWGVSSGAL
jgi:hypothetical protein